MGSIPLAPGTFPSTSLDPMYQLLSPMLTQMQNRYGQIGTLGKMIPVTNWGLCLLAMWFWRSCTGKMCTDVQKCANARTRNCLLTHSFATTRRAFPRQPVNHTRFPIFSPVSRTLDLPYIQLSGPVHPGDVPWNCIAQHTDSLAVTDGVSVGKKNIIQLTRRIFPPRETCELRQKQIAYFFSIVKR